MSNIFTLIKEPEENPSNLLDSYRQQNIIMQKMRMFIGVMMTENFLIF